MGYLIKLDSNGTNPEALEKVIDLVDYVAMDVKAPLNNQQYSQITQVDIDTDKLKKSIQLIQNKAKDYEFRTTMEPSMTKEDILNIVKDIKGSKKYYLQEFKTTNTLVDESYENKKGLLKEDIQDIVPLLKESFPIFDIR
jgi:pyruvate formate lyase activating enzyme